MRVKSLKHILSQLDDDDIVCVMMWDNDKCIYKHILIEYPATHREMRSESNDVTTIGYLSMRINDTFIPGKDMEVLSE